MTKGLHVPSEIGKLRKVCLHRPGDELLNLPPDELERLLVSATVKTTNFAIAL